jgi:hypothetical protein
MSNGDMTIIKLALMLGVVNVLLVALGLWKLGELLVGVV